MNRCLFLPWLRLAFVLVLISVSASAQETSFRSSLTATTTVAVNAHKKGRIGVNLRTTTLTFSVDASHGAQPISIPITTTWNVSPTEVSGVEVIAYFDDPDRALIDDKGDAVPSGRVSGRVGAGPFASFSETNFFGPTGASLRLFGETISHANARSTRHDVLQVRLVETNTGMPRLYSGVLNLESRYF
jgi:hypothetical protein